MDVPFHSSFAGRSVFLTGHTGFKGSWLAIWLQQLGAYVHGYSLAPPTQPSSFEVAEVRELLAGHYECDMRDIDSLAGAIDKANPEIVFHLAAQPIVRTSYETPRETIETNFMGTCNLLECVRRRAKPCVVVVVTSDKCYENREQVWGYRENDAMGGHDPYSASKGAVEILVASYRRSFFGPEDCGEHGVKLATARAGNVIGGGDWAKDRIVPDAARHLAEGKPVPVRCPWAVRPWQHVLEPLSGYLSLAAKMMADDDPQWCDGWNFAPETGDDATVCDVVETFCRAWGQGTWEDMSDPTQPHEANVLRLSIEKAIARLDWRPIWDFHETVVRTARWYRNYYSRNKASMRDACLDDIRSYATAAGGRESLCSSDVQRRGAAA
ncbi:MAG: CDP-glucose 4,6-dehydratase [Pirellulaceae bacterium]|nr:CDP-glucose 4,6-dehydratase [Pirellulaceae bacterium]